MLSRGILFGIGLALLTVPAAGLWLWRDFRSYLDAPLPIDSGGLLYRVERGSSLRSVADDLQARGILSKPHYLVLSARLAGQHRAIKAGEFFIPAEISARELLALLVAGREVQHRLTLVEGSTFEEILGAVRAHEALRHTLDGLDPFDVMDRLELGGVDPEGRFYPDTYFFPAGTTDVSLLRRAYDRMQEVLNEEWARRAPGLPVTTPYEGLILASIIEKETGRAEERKVIAGVFVRRLEKGMKLQTDPTVIYALGGSFDGDLKRRHLRMDHPHNTYVHAGLPPTPIGAPGRAAIRAAFHPAPGDALYFVGKGDGSHHFSATLAEHESAVVRYQLNGAGR